MIRVRDLRSNRMTPGWFTYNSPRWFRGIEVWNQTCLLNSNHRSGQSLRLECGCDWRSTKQYPSPSQRIKQGQNEQMKQDRQGIWDINASPVIREAMQLTYGSESSGMGRNRAEEKCRNENQKIYRDSTRIEKPDWTSSRCWLGSGYWLKRCWAMQLSPEKHQRWW